MDEINTPLRWEIKNILLKIKNQNKHNRAKTMKLQNKQKKIKNM